MLILKDICMQFKKKISIFLIAQLKITLKIVLVHTPLPYIDQGPLVLNLAKIDWCVIMFLILNLKIKIV